MTTTIQRITFYDNSTRYARTWTRTNALGDPYGFVVSFRDNTKSVNVKTSSSIYEATRRLFQEMDRKNQTDLQVCAIRCWVPSLSDGEADNFFRSAHLMRVAKELLTDQLDIQMLQEKDEPRIAEVGLRALREVFDSSSQEPVTLASPSLESDESQRSWLDSLLSKLRARKTNTAG